MQKGKIQFLFIFLVICFLGILPFSFVEAKTKIWVKEIFERIIDYGHSSSFDFEIQGRPDIFYVRRPGNFIDYAYFSKDNSRLFFERVVLNGSFPKIKVDRHNIIRGIYLKYGMNGFTCGLGYMQLSKDKTKWFYDSMITFDFDKVEDCPKSIDFALDNKDRPYFAYINPKTKSLYYGKKLGGKWRIKRLAATYPNSPLAFTVDRQNNLHFVFVAENKIKYLFYGQNKKIKVRTIYKYPRDIEKVPKTEMPKIAMVVDEHSQPHIVYIRQDVVQKSAFAFSLPTTLEYVTVGNDGVIDKVKIESQPYLSSVVGGPFSIFSDLPLALAQRGRFVYILYNLDPNPTYQNQIPSATSKIVRISYPGFKRKTKFVNILDFGSYQMKFDKKGILHIVASENSRGEKSLVVYKKIKF